MEGAKNRLEMNDNARSGEYSKETAGRKIARHVKTDLAVATAILIGTQAFANIVDVVGLHQDVQIPVNICVDSSVQYGAGIGKFCVLQNQNVKETVRELLELQMKSNTSEIEEMLPSSDGIKNEEAVSVPAAGWTENETKAPAGVVEEAAEDVLGGVVQSESSLQIAIPDVKASDEKVLDVQVPDGKASDVPVSEMTDEIQRNASDTSRDILEELINIGNFAVDKDGIIEMCIDPYAASVDDTIIIPSDERCTGIGSSAFEKIAEVSEVMEVYIPANITYIDEKAFDKLNSLIYIEVAEENPTYESIEGVLYDREGNIVVYPSGREGDA